jgi:hypothetical protein
VTPRSPSACTANVPVQALGNKNTPAHALHARFGAAVGACLAALMVRSAGCFEPPPPAARRAAMRPASIFSHRRWPPARATCDVVRRGCADSATIRSFSSRLQRRRRSTDMIVTIAIALRANSPAKQGSRHETLTLLDSPSPMRPPLPAPRPSPCPPTCRSAASVDRLPSTVWCRR